MPNKVVAISPFQILVYKQIPSGRLRLRGQLLIRAEHDMTSGLTGRNRDAHRKLVGLFRVYWLCRLYDPQDMYRSLVIVQG
jgi:hypothetical protein